MRDAAYQGKVREMYERARNRIEQFHLRRIDKDHGPVILISTQYPGAWMEHTFDAVCYARLFPEDPRALEVLRSQISLFLDFQREDGRLPFNIMDEELAAHWVGLGHVNYNQIQECVSFGTLCVEAYDILRDRAFLEKAYACMSKWDQWLCTHRRTLGTGLIEAFCVFDTGHDNSARFQGIPDQCPDLYGAVPVAHDVVPLLTPDMNAVFYGDRMALSRMAGLLHRPAESAEWHAKAEATRRELLERLYDSDDQFFYDTDCWGNRRKYLSIAISNVFCEHVADQALFDAIYDRYMRNENAFWSAYPFPSMALCDPARKNHTPNNCWGYFSMALTALRAMRWMDDYGRSGDYDILLEKWLEAYTDQPDLCFTQEMDPETGVFSDCSPWYSTAMLLYMYASRRLGYIS